MTSLMMLIKRKQQGEEDMLRSSSSMKAGGLTLAPLMEGPTPEKFDKEGKKEGTWEWVKGQLVTKSPSMSWALSMSNTKDSLMQVEAHKHSDLRLLLGVLGAPLAPVGLDTSNPLPFLSVKNIAMETSSAQYIIQQYVCATGVVKLTNVRNMYAMGRVKMLATEFETATEVVKTKNSVKSAESGCFVLWQMEPNMWNMEMAVGGSKVHAGCNGKLVWRYTPWLGSYAAKGPVRPLRRVLQGLDPRTIASLWSKGARCIGEKQVKGEDCFILKLAADAATLAGRSEGPAEIIRHLLFGYFSQKTGLLVHVEDSHLTRIQTSPGDAVLWETTIESSLDDYRSVEGAMIAHSGRSSVTLFRFGEEAMSHTRTRLEEEWVIDEVAFDVPGLSSELFIPPSDIRMPLGSTFGEVCELSREKKNLRLPLKKNKAATLEKAQESLQNVM